MHVNVTVSVCVCVRACMHVRACAALSIATFCQSERAGGEEERGREKKKKIKSSVVQDTLFSVPRYRYRYSGKNIPRYRYLKCTLNILSYFDLSTKF